LYYTRYNKSSNAAKLSFRLALACRDHSLFLWERVGVRDWLRGIRKLPLFVTLEDLSTERGGIRKDGWALAN
jgi:hypothetical protein